MALLYNSSTKDLLKDKSPIIFLLLLVFYSCVYSPPEERTYVDPKSTPPNVVNQILDLDKDTLFVYSKTMFSFLFQSDKQTIWGIKIDCLGKSYNFDGPSGYFYVDTLNQKDGIYKVKMQLYTHTGTGSLSDQLGGETYVFSKEWVLIIEKAVKPTVFFTGTSIENGYLQIHWKKFDKPYFRYYELLIRDSCLNYATYSKKFYDKDMTSFADSFFVGGKVDFTLLIHYTLTDNKDNYFTSDKFAYRFPVILNFIEHKDSLTVTWRKIPFNHTVSRYYQINMGQDTSFTIKSPGMGTPLGYDIYINPEYIHAENYQIYEVHGSHTLGINSDMVFSRMEYFPEINSYFLKFGSYVRKYDANNLSRLFSFDYNWDYHDYNTITLSPDKSKIFTTVMQDVVQLNSSDLQVIKADRFTPTIGTDNTYYNLIHIINDSLMYIVYNSNLSIYNFINNSIICTIGMFGSPEAPYNISISKDGNYIANCGATSLIVYKNNSNKSLDKIYEIEGNFMECIFDPLNVNNLLVLGEGRYIAHVPDMKTIFIIPNRIQGLAANFDPETGNLLFVSNLDYSLTVYNYMQDSIIFKSTHHEIFNRFYLAKNNIFFTEGYHMKINSNE